jgi:hypothetical protein
VEEIKTAQPLNKETPPASPASASQGETPQDKPERKSFSIKWLSLGIGVVLILVILGGTYFLGKNSTSKTPTTTQEQVINTSSSPTPITSPTPTTNPTTETTTPSPSLTPDETANWNLHKNVDYPFQIKYPKDWTLRTTYGNSVKNTGNNRVAGIDINTGTPGYGSVLIVNIINPQGKNLEDWLRQNMSNAYIPTKTSFQGFSAYRYSYSTQSNRLDTVEIYFQYSDKIIFLAWNLISGVDQPTADQIMSSLKFTQ